MNATDQGFYNLSDTGQLASDGYVYVGANGNGTFVQTGGSHSIAGGKFLDLGLGFSSSGMYQLSGGTLNTPQEFIGNQG
jgi:hypothetical protein